MKQDFFSTQEKGSSDQEPFSKILSDKILKISAGDSESAITKQDFQKAKPTILTFEGQFGGFRAI